MLRLHVKILKRNKIKKVKRNYFWSDILEIQALWLVTTLSTRDTSKRFLNIEFPSVMLQALALIFHAYHCSNFKRIKREWKSLKVTLYSR